MTLIKPTVETMLFLNDYLTEIEPIGLSFSVLMPTKPPPSLKNIYKQLETDIPGFKAPLTGYDRL